ncbi:hypothetical protein CHS0354_029709 [Potamilus streckersoni]|uniref:Laminin subunit beta-2 n=1 Tax=Potamilus streckersoni TaxID=2493646 RepID=A0AAE0RTM2_9BIVA|nr:hypothetical protein CHS0354_029709 [Potamilus streckersoni]
MESLHLGIFLVTVIAIQDTKGQVVQPQCERGSCYPATGDLLIGREKNLTTNSTCGLDRPERYCIVSHLEDVKKCFVCDSRRPWATNNRESHRIENIVSSFRERKLRWWQAENGEQNVYIQLDLEAEFHFTHLIMTFKTFRPKAMYVERSFDFGQTWNVYRYFAADCAKSFPGIPTSPVRNLKDVICISKYSEVAPSTEGEVIFRVLPPFIRIADPYSQDVQDLLKLTNIRIVFTELHTLGDTVFDSRQDIKEKYYYSMYDMTVRGSCSCYGHASRCIPVEGYPNYPNMVHGQCECTHNTRGLNCEMCQDFYNDLPWRPARTNEPNACQKCNCNNHATKCHFDPAVYELTGRVSGGVCDDCQHNTMGRNCQECRPFFYQDPNRDIRDPEICQPCDCDPDGSQFKGECENREDPANGMVAGRCICKQNVEGRRCDTCKSEFWNLRDDNPEGCEPCTCSPMGTIPGFGCDQATGMCTCKRYVTGKNCDQCYPGYWGMSADVYGCRLCDCDVGGARGDDCDVITGECECKPFIMGRQCNQVQPGYFFTRLDYYMYEAEFAVGIGNTRVFIREPVPGYQSWTGPGFMRIMEGDSLLFTDVRVDFPMYYDVVIRYDPRMPEKWDDVRVTVERPGPTDQAGPCANAIPQDDNKAVSLQPGSRHVVVPTQSCLERGIKYTIRIGFTKYRSDLNTPEATALIDSIILVPSTESIPIFQGPGLPEYMKYDFIRYRCRELQLHVHRPELPEICRKLTFSISAIIHQKALECDCDLTGSLSFECDPVGGQCQCKSNVVGRRCDQCAPGTYGFGLNGCTPCNCHAIGARDNFCDIVTGQCLCVPNVDGRICDVCTRGYYGFPRCRPCQCNANAEICDDLTGRCINCQNHTIGDNCERCEAGFYGDPRVEYRISCQPCLCPGGPYSKIQHADGCDLDTRSQSVVCNCYAGFRGPNCNVCADNFFGDPSVENGTCESCVCNNNIDPNVPGSCDTTTGECLKCLYNTEGFNCEKCKPGYYGNALTQSCQECICSPLGTDFNRGPCDRETGQCHCLPNVVGLRCDKSATGFWNITPGVGSEPCNCDPVGSLGIECNELDGQCQCKPGRGGRRCSECENFFWGDPNFQCYPCECNTQGSAAMQCDRRTGQCVCLTGITGYKCDRCDRGTTGELPNCQPCGECFNNWDRVVRDLRDQTRALLDQAKDIQTSGASGAFDKEFRNMEEKLEEIRKIIDSSGVSSSDVDQLKNKLAQIRLNLTDNMQTLNAMDTEMQNTIGRIQEGNNRIRALELGITELKLKADDLRSNASDIQAKDVEGAFNITKEAQVRSQEAQNMVNSTRDMIQQSEVTRQQAESLLNQNRGTFNQSLEENEKSLADVDNQVMDLSNRIAEINDMVCDGNGNPCDDVCGGGGCGKCGGPSCENGAVTKADNALDLAMKAEELLKVKEQNANHLYKNVSAAHMAANEAKIDSQMAYDEAMKARNISESTRTNLKNLLNRTSDYLKDQGAKPEQIEQIAQEVLRMSISLTPDQIMDLANQINETIQGLQNIDSILEDTRDDLSLAQRLKERADNASLAAASILEIAESVLNALNGSREAQDEARKAIDKAKQDIQFAENDFTMIESETAAAEEKSTQTSGTVKGLNDDLSKLKSKITANRLKVEDAEKLATDAAALAAKADQDAADLERKYPDALKKLNDRYNSTSDAKTRVDTLKRRADKLATETTTKLNRLRSMNTEFSMYEKELQTLAGKIDELNANMTIYLEAIQQKAEDYRLCKTE